MVRAPRSARLVTLTARAQGLSAAYTGKFTLTTETRWGDSILKPGTYTITIRSTDTPIVISIRSEDGKGSAFVMTGTTDGNRSGLNALLLGEKHGQPTVHSLAIADLGMVLVYDRSLAREENRHAREKWTLPVLWAKK